MRKAPTPSFIQKMRHYADRFDASDDTIYTAYVRPSKSKIRAYEELCNIAIDGDCRVLGHNCDQFTTGMYTTDKETGEVVFQVNTKNNVYTIPVNYVSPYTVTCYKEREIVSKQSFRNPFEACNFITDIITECGFDCLFEKNDYIPDDSHGFMIYREQFYKDFDEVWDVPFGFPYEVKDMLYGDYSENTHGDIYYLG